MCVCVLGVWMYVCMYIDTITFCNIYFKFFKFSKKAILLLRTPCRTGTGELGAPTVEAAVTMVGVVAGDDEGGV